MKTYLWRFPTIIAEDPNLQIYKSSKRDLLNLVTLVANVVKVIMHVHLQSYFDTSEASESQQSEIDKIEISKLHQSPDRQLRRHIIAINHQLIYLLVKFFPHTWHITVRFWTNRARIPAQKYTIKWIKTKAFVYNLLTIHTDSNISSLYIWNKKLTGNASPSPSHIPDV